MSVNKNSENPSIFYCHFERERGEILPVTGQWILPCDGAKIAVNIEVSSTQCYFWSHFRNLRKEMKSFIIKWKVRVSV